MKQIKKTLCTLALGLFGVLAVNAQTGTNLVKNGDFEKDSENWEVSDPRMELDFTGERPFKGNSMFPKGNIETGDYVFQKIENIQGAEYKINFTFKVWYDLFKVKLVWNTGVEQEVFDSETHKNDTGAAYYTYHDFSTTGTIPVGATSVEIRFVDNGLADPADSRAPSNQAFYIDDVFFEVSGTPIPPEPLKAPQNVKISDVTKTGFKLSWDAVDKAKGYEVIVNGETKQTNSSTTTLDITGLNAGVKYTVKIKGVSAAPDNKVATIDIFTISEEKADGNNVFFDGGTFKNGDTDLNKGWLYNLAVSTTDADIDGNVSTKMRIQNDEFGVIVRSYDFSVEGGKKYTISAMVKSPKEDKSLLYRVVWKKADGTRLSGGFDVGKTEGVSWQTIANELVVPEEAVVAEVQFQLPLGAENLVFYVDDVKVIKGVVAPKVEIKDVHQRNVKVSYMGIKGKTYKVALNGKELELSEGGYINGLKPGTEYTVEVYRTDATDKKATEKFTTEKITNSTPIAHLSDIDADGNVAQEFFYDIVDLEGDEVESIKAIYNGNPIEVKGGKITLPETGGRLEVEITQKGGATTTLTYYTVNFK